jgi:hypothetical protein
VPGTSVHLCERQQVSFTLELPYPLLFAATHDSDATAAPPWTL